MEVTMIVWAAWKNTVSKDALRITPKPKFKPVKLRKKTGEVKPLRSLEVQP